MSTAFTWFLKRRWTPKLSTTTRMESLSGLLVPGRSGILDADYEVVSKPQKAGPTELAALSYRDERDQEHIEGAPQRAYRRGLCWPGRPQLPGTCVSAFGLPSCSTGPRCCPSGASQPDCLPLFWMLLQPNAFVCFCARPTPIKLEVKSNPLPSLPDPASTCLSEGIFPHPLPWLTELQPRGPLVNASGSRLGLHLGFSFAGPSPAMFFPGSSTAWLLHQVSTQMSAPPGSLS